MGQGESPAPPADPLVRQLLRLWKEQDGICPVCEQRITELGWHNHHIVWRVMGGSDKYMPRDYL